MSLYRISKKEPYHQPLTKRCIILDLDETLVHSSEDYRTFKQLRPFNNPALLDLRRRMYNFSLIGYDKAPTVWGVTRPYVQDFLIFCFSYFTKVCVWSAGSPEYVKKIVEHIFPPGYEPHAVYSRNQCHYAQNGELFKPIHKMTEQEGWEDVLRLDNTLFIDDRPQAFYKNPKNGIVIPVYEPEDEIASFTQDDHCLVDIMQWLVLPEVLEAEDVRLLDKSRIFTEMNIEE